MVISIRMREVMEKNLDIFRLHIGGYEVKAGWKIMNIQPGKGVDFVGDIQDLSRFADACCDEIYASHVLEHVMQARVLPTLQGFRRILKPGGRALVSVPDLEVLCRLFLHPQMTTSGRVHVSKMIYGAQVDAADFHYVGFSFEFLSEYVAAAGFSKCERVTSFGIFNDGSIYAPYGVPISLNVIAYKE